jgi:hypothetical protein
MDNRKIEDRPSYYEKRESFKNLALQYACLPKKELIRKLWDINKDSFDYSFDEKFILKLADLITRLSEEKREIHDR